MFFKTVAGFCLCVAGRAYFQRYLPFYKLIQEGRIFHAADTVTDAHGAEAQRIPDAFGAGRLSRMNRKRNVSYGSLTEQAFEAAGRKQTLGAGKVKAGNAGRKVARSHGKSGFVRYMIVRHTHTTQNETSVHGKIPAGAF